MSTDYYLRPSGGIVAPYSEPTLNGIPSQPAATEPIPYELTDAALQALTGQPPAPTEQPVEPPAARTFTYRLPGGGALTVDCPDWCIGYELHKGDLDGTLHPVDLCHEGNEISLSFTTNEGERDTILAARITQYPFAPDDGSELPHMALMPVAGNGETLGYQTPAEVYAEIRRVREYLVKLEQLNGQLLALLSDPLPAWMSLSADDIETMSIPDLLAAFEAAVVEVDECERGGPAILHEEGELGLLRVHLVRSLTQQQREAVVRNLFLRFTGQNR